MWKKTTYIFIDSVRCHTFTTSMACTLKTRNKILLMRACTRIYNGEI